MLKGDLYLILNLGMKSVRIIVFDAQAKIYFKNSYPVHTWIREDLIEQDPEEWLPTLHTWAT